VERPVSGARPIPALRGIDGWREVAIEAVPEPLVAVDDVGGRVLQDPQYHARGLPGTIPDCLVREGIAERLARAAASLPDGLTLVVWDGYRSLETQAALYDGFVARLDAEHPGWPRERLEWEAARYVTPPLARPESPPPHLTGGAVDLTLGDGDGRPLDLGTPFDAFVPEAGALALEDRPGGARELRRTLFWAMAGQGFTVYAEEWWHFDLGDQFWGVIRERPARYAAADPRA
jgi:zinc D-Ala-D-Ala dipeptidase